MYYGTPFGMKKAGGNTPASAAGMPGQSATPANPIVPPAVVQTQTPPVQGEAPPEPANALHKALLKLSQDLAGVGAESAGPEFSQGSPLGQSTGMFQGKQTPFWKMVAKGGG